MDTINTYCISCKVTTPHVLLGSERTITNRTMSRMACLWLKEDEVLCLTYKQELGQPDRVIARSKAKDNLKHGPIPHHRPDLLRATHKVRFIQGGCTHCGGDLRTDLYDPAAMTCFQCGRTAGWVLTQEVA